MVPNTDAKQLTLQDNGHIFWQQDPSNPLPGVAVACVMKGASALAPIVDLLPELPLQGPARDAALAQIGDWLNGYIARVLEPLVKLKLDIDGTPEGVKAICDRVYDGLGVVPRADVLDQIEKLDPEMRKVLRGRHVRLGPVLVFVPDLNKPAAVRLRALLWSLWNDRALPAPCPRDGAVSQVVDIAVADPAFYRSIGYPLYANRIIRIDMLDRVMNAVYENVKDNQFMATHQMAEWLGAPVADLYAVLESMGHKKVSDPAEIKVVEKSEEIVDSTAGTDAPVVGSASVEPVVIESAPVSESVVMPEGNTDPAVNGSPAIPVKKPDLAIFRVWWPRKAGSKPSGDRADRPRGPKKPYTPRTGVNLSVDGEAPAVSDSGTGDKPERRSFRERAPRTDDGKFGDRKNVSGDRKFGDRGPSSGGPAAAGRNVPGGRNVGGRFGKDSSSFGGTARAGGAKGKEKLTRTDKNLRMMAATSAPASETKISDSPFAVLGTLKF